MCCPQSLPGCSESEIKTCQNQFIFLNVFLLSASVGKHENSDAYSVYININAHTYHCQIKCRLKTLVFIIKLYFKTKFH